MCYCKEETSKNDEDPIDMMKGDFNCEYRVMSVAGVRTLYFDLRYHSLRTGEKGELGYGWYHDYESRIADENGILQVYLNPTQSIPFIRKASKDMTVQGEYHDGMVVLTQDAGEKEYEPISDSFADYRLGRSIAEEQRIENLPEAERALERVRIKEKDDRELKERMHSINTWNSIKLIIGLIVLIVVMLIEYFKI